MKHGTRQHYFPPEKAHLKVGNGSTCHLDLCLSHQATKSERQNHHQSCLGSRIAPYTPSQPLPTSPKPHRIIYGRLLLIFFSAGKPYNSRPKRVCKGSGSFDPLPLFTHSLGTYLRYRKYRRALLSKCMLKSATRYLSKNFVHNITRKSLCEKPGQKQVDNTHILVSLKY